jgi:23S rRNA (cytidine1920-2'-O)/16S rRNA (cytidine1409-2'-O)-methyltransferase
VMERPLEFANERAILVALVKPQFEAERNDVGKGGVVRDDAVRKAACDKVRDWLIESGWDILGVTESPITGPKGNVEFLIGARKP